MRLWGGHGGAPQALWDAADEFGILLFHEFWMTGDDNSPAKGGPGGMRCSVEVLGMFSLHVLLLVQQMRAIRSTTHSI